MPYKNQYSKTMSEKPIRKKILVTGATGYIGRRLTHRLLADDAYDICLFVRNRRKVQAMVSEKVEIFEGDTFDPPSLEKALSGIDTAFYLIHSMGSDKDFRNLDVESAENFRKACIKCGVRRIVYLGGLGKKDSASKHLLSRIETGEVLSSEPDEIETVWLRAGVVVGSGSTSFEIVRNLCQKLPLMLTPKWVRTKTEAIGIEDVLSYLQQSVEIDMPPNLVVDLGSEEISFQQMVTQAAKVMGLQRFLFPVPVLSPRLSSYWLILFTPVPYRIAASLVEGLKSETIRENENAAKYFPAIKPASYQESVAQALSELEHNQIVSRWCDSTSSVACDVKDFDNPAGAVLRDTRIIEFPGNVGPEQVYKQVCGLGGKNGWFRYNYLWRLRGAIDKILGGYGLTRGRRNSSELRVGDALDFWKVADIRPGKRLLLYAQMRLPGQAWLEFDIQPTQLVQTAHFIPRGLLGRAYWYAVLPFHYFVFENLAQTLVNNASSQEKTINL